MLSTPAPRRIVKIILIVMGGLIGLFVVGIALIALLFYLSAQKQKTYIDVHYKPSMPSIVHYQSRVWDSGDIDVQANWTYTYSTDTDRTSTYNALINSLQNSGYKITEGSCPFDEDLWAFNKTEGIDLTIYLNPLVNGGSPTQNVSSIQITAEENHDNVYISPDALSCSNPNS